MDTFGPSRQWLRFDGEEGAKFKRYIDCTKELEQRLEGHIIIHLCENVIMQTNAEIQWVSDQLGANPIVADPADLGIIARPRLWWTRHSWSDKDRHPLTGLLLVMDGFKLHDSVARHEK